MNWANLHLSPVPRNFQHTAWKSLQLLICLVFGVIKPGLLRLSDRARVGREGGRKAEAVRPRRRRAASAASPGLRPASSAARRGAAAAAKPAPGAGGWRPGPALLLRPQQQAAWTSRRHLHGLACQTTAASRCGIAQKCRSVEILDSWSRKERQNTLWTSELRWDQKCLLKTPTWFLENRHSLQLNSHPLSYFQHTTVLLRDPRHKGRLWSWMIVSHSRSVSLNRSFSALEEEGATIQAPRRTSPGSTLPWLHLNYPRSH